MTERITRLENGLTIATDRVHTARSVAIGDRIEILDGLPSDAKVVVSGGGFLADGDLVKVVDAPAPSIARK